MNVLLARADSRGRVFSPEVNGRRHAWGSKKHLLATTVKMSEFVVLARVSSTGEMFAADARPSLSAEQFAEMLRTYVELDEKT